MVLEKLHLGIKKLTSKNLLSLLLAIISLIISSNLEVQSAKKKNNSNSFVNLTKIFSGTGVNTSTLKVNSKELNINSGNLENSSVKFLLDSTDLVKKSKFPQVIKVRVYTKDTNDDEIIVSVLNLSLISAKHAKSTIFTVNFPDTFSSNDVYIDIYDVDGELKLGYKQFIQKTSIQSQLNRGFADCDNSSFGDCQLKYIIDAINYQVTSNKKMLTEVAMSPSGGYTVKLPLPNQARNNSSRIKNSKNSLGKNINDNLAEKIINLIKDGDFAFDRLQIAESSQLETNPADGLIEFDGDKLYLTKNGTRSEIIISTTGSGFSSPSAKFTDFVNIAPQEDPPANPNSGDVYHDDSDALCFYSGLTNTWNKISGIGTCAVGTDEDPTPFNFSNLLATASIVVNSSILTIVGFQKADISISGDGNPEYSINSGTFTSDPGVIYSGQTVQLRLTSNATIGQSQTVTITIGGVSDTWVVTTGAGCPDNFAFIPGSSGVDSFGNINATYASGWCVSQYEMSPQGTSLWVRDGVEGWHYQNSVGAGKAVTAKGGTGSFPITRISRDEASAACANDLTLPDSTSLTGGKLLTTYFWSKINQAIIDDGINWSGGTPGSGNLSRGNSSSLAPLEGIAEGTVATQPIGGTFYYIAEQGRSWRMGVGEDSVYDWAGNVWEWFDDLHSNDVGAVWNDYDPAILAFEHDNPNGAANVNLIPTEVATHDSTTNGIGRIFVNNSVLISSNTYAAIYSGSWLDGDYSGIYGSVWYSYSTSTTWFNDIGFRCIIPMQ